MRGRWPVENAQESAPVQWNALPVYRYANERERAGAKRPPADARLLSFRTRETNRRRSFSSAGSLPAHHSYFIPFNSIISSIYSFFFIVIFHYLILLTQFDSIILSNWSFFIIFFDYLVLSTDFNSIILSI